MDQRFSQITDKLFHKGYNLYPYSEEGHIQSERFCSLIRGTHKRTDHREQYLIVVPHRNFSEDELQVFRNLDDRYLKLFEIETAYAAYYDIVQLNSKYVDQVLGNCIASAKKKPGHKTHQKIFTSKTDRRATQNISPQGLSFAFNMARFRQITDTIASKGYSLYPFSQQREIEIGKQAAVILAAHEKTGQQESFTVAIPHHSLEGLVLQSIKNVCFKNSIKRLYDLDQDYLIFYTNALLTVPAIDEMLEKFRDLHHARKQVLAPKKIPLRQSASSPPAIENRLPADHIAYPINKTMQKNPDGSKPQQTMACTTRRFSAASFTRNSADVGNLQGHSIDGYKVSKKLGEGGFGFVYLVEKAGSYFVMKIAKSSQGAQSIIDEIESITQFNTMLAQPDYREFPKCVPSIYCSGKFQGLPYFVEEFILTLETLKSIIYKSSRVSKFNANTLIAAYYNDKASKAKYINEQEKYLDLASAVERILQKEQRTIPIDPLVASHVALQLMFIIYVMNANNYHYGDLKSENVGLRLEDMDIIRKDRIESSSKFEFALKENVIARQLEIEAGSFPSFCAVLLDFGSLSRYKRQDDSTIFFTPKYMVPNELTLRQGTVKKSFVKDPYTLGLVLLEMVSGLEPFWYVRLSGDADQQVGTIDAMYKAGEKAFDLEMVNVLLNLNMNDISCLEASEMGLAKLIIENAAMLMQGVFKEEIVSIITHLRKNLMKYYHREPSRYQALKRYSEHDELRLSGRKGFRK